MEITRAVTRIFRAGRVFHASYSCYLCPACAERVRGLFAKTFQRDSSVSSSRSLSSNFPGSFVPPLLAPPLVHAFSFFFFFFVSFSLFFFRPATRLCIAETLCIASNILCDLIALALIHSGIFFFIFNSTLKKLH